MVALVDVLKGKDRVIAIFFTLLVASTAVRGEVDHVMMNDVALPSASGQSGRIFFHRLALVLPFDPCQFNDVTAPRPHQ